MDGQQLTTTNGNGASEALREFQGLRADVREVGEKSVSVERKLDALQISQAELEQKIFTRGGGGGVPALSKSWGTQVVSSEELKQFARSARDRARIEIKGLTSAVDSGGALAPPTQIAEPVVLPRTVLRVRDLPRVVRVDSGAVYFPKMMSRDLNPQSVAEGQLKPASDLTFAAVTEQIRTIAHHITISKQLLADSGAVVQSLLNTELRWGLKNEEDRQLMVGTGTVVAPASGAELLGMLPQATPYSAPITIPTPTAIDKIAAAIAQIRIADYEADAIVLHPADFLALQTLKDDTGRYLLGEPATAAPLQLLSLPIVITKSVPQGVFLAGAFKQVTVIWDREEVAILVSYDSQDNFVRNNVTFLCEERLGFSVMDPFGLVKGTL